MGGLYMLSKEDRNTIIKVLDTDGYHDVCDNME